MTTIQQLYCNDSRKNSFNSATHLISPHKSQHKSDDKSHTIDTKLKLKLLRKFKDITLQNQFRNLFANQFDTKLTRQPFTYTQRHFNPFALFYKKRTFHNQQLFGKEIFNNYVNNNQLIHTLAIAPTQSGKTGSMLSLIHHFSVKSSHFVPHSNIFIFTGHSSKEWLIQTRQRFPSVFRNNILHRNQLKTLIAKLKNMTNVLLILDEVHIAMKFGQTLFQLFKALNYFDIVHLLRNNIKIVSFTATPDTLPKDILVWKQFAQTVYMQVPDTYLSIERLLQSNRIRQVKDLTGFDKHTQSVNTNVVYQNFFEYFDTAFQFEPSYHIIRTSRGNLHTQLIANFVNAFHLYYKSKPQFIPTNFNHLYKPIYVHDNLNHSAFIISEKYSHDFNFDLTLSIKPHTHTFIFIVDKLRCAKTIHHLFIATLYERFVHKPQFNSTVQSLAGRLSGYHHNFHAICFTFIQSISRLLTHKHNPNILYPF